MAFGGLIADASDGQYFLDSDTNGGTLVLSQAIANEPALGWGRGRFTPLFGRLVATLPALYPPARP